jgi:hypothetical protein
MGPDRHVVVLANDVDILVGRMRDDIDLGIPDEKVATISRIANCIVATAAVQRTVPVGSFSRWRMAVSASSASRNITTAWR